MGNNKAMCSPSGSMPIADQCSRWLPQLKSCSITKNLERGKRIHMKVLESGNDLNIRVATALVNMYAKCGSMFEAHQVFDSIRRPDVVSWTALLMGYAENGEGLVALNLFARMKSQGCQPDSATYVAALKACASLAQRQDSSARAEVLQQAKEIHVEIGSRSSLFVQNTLIDMYGKCGSMVDAHQVFDSMMHPSVVSWTNLLLGYVDSGESLIALDLFSRMKSQGWAPISRTYVAALKACACLALKQDSNGRKECLERGKKIHSQIGCHLNCYVQSILVDMYAKCGSMVDARQVFDGIGNPDVVSWNTLLSGYADNGEESMCLDLFSRMRCTPTPITYVAVLKAVASLAVKGNSNGRVECLEQGKQIHLQVGCHLNIYVKHSLIDMYAKCGSIADARQVFESIKDPDVVSWTALLLGYADIGEGLVALDLFSRMKSQGCAPNSITYLGALRACGLLGALEVGRKIHAELNEFDSMLVTCLVDFYGKCGSLAEARGVFDLHCKKGSVATWTALLSGYSSFGDTGSVFGLYEGMQDAGIQPDDVTFQCILTSCSHAGLVEKAKECFEAMPTKYGVIPRVEHYNCMVDALGRANKLDDALMLLHRMPCSSDFVTWMTVLSACRKWKNVEMGWLAFQSLVTMDASKAAAYVLMAHIYASKGMWEEQEMVLGMRRKFGNWQSR